MTDRHLFIILYKQLLERKKMSEKNYLIRQQDLLKKVRRDYHRPTKISDKNYKAYSRKQKHPKSFLLQED